jgi:hypothetical protein
VSDGAAAGRLEARFGTLLEALALLASLGLLAMVFIICGDVLTRNVAIPACRAASPGATRSPSCCSTR